MNIETIQALLRRLRDEYRVLLGPELSREMRAEQLARTQGVRRKLVILIEECHLQVKKVRPYIDMLEQHYREVRSLERKLAALRGPKRASTAAHELQERLAELHLVSLEPSDA